MKKIYLYLLLCSFLSTFHPLLAQWEYNHTPLASTLQSSGIDLIELSNGHFASIGTRSFDAPPNLPITEGMVVVVDEAGEEQFTRYLGSSNIHVGSSLIESSGGIILFGNESYGPTESYIKAIKIDFDNEVVWEKRLGAYLGSNASTINAIGLDDGSTIVTYNVKDNTLATQTLLQRIGDDGATISIDTIYTINNAYEYSNSIALASDGNLLLTGESEIGHFIKKNNARWSRDMDNFSARKYSYFNR